MFTHLVGMLTHPVAMPAHLVAMSTHPHVCPAHIVQRVAEDTTLEGIDIPRSCLRFHLAIFRVICEGSAPPEEESA